MARPSWFRATGGLLAAIGMGSVLIGGAAALVVPVTRALAEDSVELDLPNPVLPPLAVRSTVYDSAGRRMAVLHSGENRAPVPLAEVPDVVVDAVLAAEDRGFYEHDGVDVRGIGRALRRNLDAGAVEQGGSTITQQLVKNTLFHDPERDLSRKVKEAVLALGLEETYTKEQILEHYLNTIYLGNGAYGISSAAERYFGKTVPELGLAEAALLAGLIANPEGRDPVEFPANAARARQRVLAAMVDAGWATRADADAANATPLPADVTPLVVEPVEDPFVEEVKRQLLRDDRIGATYDERFNRVFRGGLRIYTTYDVRTQAAAELAVRNILPDDVPYTATLVAIENGTGAVRAMVPGTSFSHAGFNLATQGTRQTGSSFKVFTLAAAIDAGYSPDDRVNASGECEFDMGENAAPWKVENYDGRGMGNVTLTSAIARSSNCAFARVALALGPEKIVDMAHRLGIERELEPVPSITLGTQPVSPLEMAAAFSTLASEGLRRPPRFIERVEARDGTVLIGEPPAPERVLDTEVARTVTSMLSEVIDDGTGTGADFGRPAAGKTGTNQAHRDAWFVGYTPQMTAAVWIGNADAQIPIEIDGTRVTGGSYPARIWRDFMRAVHDGAPVLEFTAPDEARWPRAGSISEEGRALRPRAPAPAPSTTVAPSDPNQPASPAPAPASPGTTAPPPTPNPGPPSDGGTGNQKKDKET